MMTGTDVLRLLDQGYTKAEIEALRAAEDEGATVKVEPVIDQADQADQADQGDQIKIDPDNDLVIENKEVQTIAAIAALNKTVEQLTATVEAIQKNNIAGAKIDAPPVVSIDEVLTSFIQNM